MNEKELRSLMADLGASLFMRGFSVGGAGNLSCRLPDGSILATPTNSCLGRLDPGELSIADTNGRHVSGAPPTKELPLHLAVYTARPHCAAVAHLHSTYATALSCRADLDAANALSPFTPYYVMRIGQLPVVPYHRPGSPALARNAGVAAATAPAFLLANHGAVACGASLTEAVNNAEELEETVKLHIILEASGVPVRHLTPGEVAELQG